MARPNKKNFEEQAVEKLDSLHRSLGRAVKIFEWFAENFDKLDKQAKNTLADLAAIYHSDMLTALDGAEATRNGTEGILPSKKK